MTAPRERAGIPVRDGSTLARRRDAQQPGGGGAVVAAAVPELDVQQMKAMVFNPEVTVRSRGVMEKCTFCVQRIQNAKIKAKNAKRTIPDGEIHSACQDACPSGAIVFGDLNDDSAEVTSLAQQPRAYALLGELNNRPRVRYLGRVRNPNPELA